MDIRRSSPSMATECLDMFYGIDRAAFKMLTQSLHRDVTLSLLVMAFLMSLEIVGLGSVISQATNKGSWFMNKLADECVICLRCLLSPVVTDREDKMTKLDSLQLTLRTELTISQVHEMRSVLLQKIKESLDTICPRVLGDLTMNAVWMEYQRNPAMLLGLNTVVDGGSHAIGKLPRHQPHRPLLAQEGGRLSQPEKVRQKYVCKELDNAERPKTLTVCFGRESVPTAEPIVNFFSNWFGQVVEKVTVHPRKDKDSGDYSFVLFNDASIPRIIMGDKNIVHHRIHGMKSWIRWWTGTHFRSLE